VGYRKILHSAQLDYRPTVVPRHTQSYTEIGRRLLAKVMFTDRHSTVNRSKGIAATNDRIGLAYQ